MEPAGSQGYFQPVKFQVRRIDEDHSALFLIRNGISRQLTLGEDAMFSLRSNLRRRIDAEMVFVGYGLSIPEAGYDDLAGIDLKGKIAVYLSGGPASVAAPLRAHAQSSSERWKALHNAGAIGTAAIPNPDSMDIPWDRAKLARLQPSMSLAGRELDATRTQRFALTINPARAEPFFEDSGHTFDEIVRLARENQPLPRFPLRASVRAKVEVRMNALQSENVVAVLPGSDPKLKDEYIVLSAHLDHVGVGAPVEGDSIYNGAMDNAAGVASVIELGRMLQESGAKLRRSVIFLLVTGEEKGLLGSRFFALQPTVKGRIVANINLDMFLPIHALTHLVTLGLDESTLGESLRVVASTHGIQILPDPEPQRNLFIRSDQYSFIRQGVPALAFKFGYEKGSPEEQLQREWIKRRYHAPSDDVHQPVDKDAAVRFNRLMLALVEHVANGTSRPQWSENSFFKRFAR